ncbi:MAG: hypothetical protein HQ568_10790 [Calditrichaeota bacterium]|nr:hypothetical protein [Calditrichota bacterium]
MGHLVPAGTGVKKYRSIVVDVVESDKDDVEEEINDENLAEQMETVTDEIPSATKEESIQTVKTESERPTDDTILVG